MANASLEWYNSNCFVNHVPVNHTTSTHLNGNIGLEFVGRLGNNMIQYMHARLHAYHRGSGIIEVSNGPRNSDFGKDIKDFSTVVWVQAQGAHPPEHPEPGPFPRQRLLTCSLAHLLTCSPAHPLT